VVVAIQVPVMGLYLAPVFQAGTESTPDDHFRCPSTLPCETGGQ